jgi:hypothetical protein
MSAFEPVDLKEFDCAEFQDHRKKTGAGSESVEYLSRYPTNPGYYWIKYYTYTWKNYPNQPQIVDKSISIDLFEVREPSFGVPLNNKSVGEVMEIWEFGWDAPKYVKQEDFIEYVKVEIPLIWKETKNA